MKPSGIVKRDGREVPFEQARIASALDRALRATGTDDAGRADELARVVSEHLERTCDTSTPDIELVQDATVHVLQESGHYEAALAFARYRDARERLRRGRRAQDGSTERLNLVVIDGNGRRRPWDRDMLVADLVASHGLDAKAAGEAVARVEADLADSNLTELQSPLLLSLIDAALVRLGMHSSAAAHAALRVGRTAARCDLGLAVDGREALERAGRRVLLQLSLAESMPPEVVRLFVRGRLWIDGLDDPRRGAQFTAAVDGHGNPWQVLTQAFALAAEAAKQWRRVRLVLPPCILGHLERNAQALVAPITALSEHGWVHLYCDGRTSLLDNWPFAGRRVSIATWQDDFLLLRQLQERGLPLLAGPHLMSGAWRGRVLCELALNAQGLEGEFAQMDALAASLVEAAVLRLAQVAHLGQGDVRFAIYGLPLHGSSSEYLERQVMQAAARAGVALSRSANLPEEACLHLGRLLES